MAKILAKDIIGDIKMEFELPSEAGLGFGLLLGFGYQILKQSNNPYVFIANRELGLIGKWIDKYLEMPVKEKDKVLRYFKKRLGD